MPKVSVIIPVYNVEKYLARCIESILTQTLVDWELILVDDCGVDKSMQIARKYSTFDNRIITLSSSRNEGPMIAREKGYKASTGDYITFVDGDDTLPPNALTDLYESAIKYNSDIVMGQIQRCLSDNQFIPFTTCIFDGLIEKEVIYQLLLKGVFPHNLCAKLFKAELLRGVSHDNFENFTNGEDGYLFLQIFENVSRFSAISQTVYFYWTYETSSSHKKLTNNMVKGISRFEKLKYDILKRHLGNIDKEFYSYLHLMASDIAKNFPRKELESIFNNDGLNLDLSFLNLLNYYNLFKSIKIYIKVNIYRKLYCQKVLILFC